MLILQNITYIHPNRDLLFDNLNFSINKHDKIALIGNNGVGKSTLLKIITGNLQPSGGLIKTSSRLYYVPQLFGQYNDLTIAEAIGIEPKLKALKEILSGNVSDENMTMLENDWAIEERCKEAFTHWDLAALDLSQKLDSLSGGQKTKVFLAGISIHQPQIVLLDEPSNHLDVSSRNTLYNYIKATTNTLVIVSHDRTLLNLLDTVCELNKGGINTYGGNYDFYIEQKNIENQALALDLKSKEKALRKAKETERESVERQQKLDARGKKKQEKAGLPTISMKTLKNNAEKSTSRMKDVHTEKVNAISQELTQLRKEVPDIDKMKMDFSNSALHNGKTLITARNLNFGYGTEVLWKQGLNFQIKSGERLAVKGTNGSGKTTLIKMILGKLEPTSGIIDTVAVKAVYIDQDYSLINEAITVYEQAQQYNSGALQEHEVKIRLNRSLFTSEFWNKPCKALSGGEKMRLILCCLTISTQAPDMMILDEPTNNLDIQNTDILTIAINAYRGTLIVISHDEHFLKQVNAGNSIVLTQ